jgi:hypothetical protein
MTGRGRRHRWALPVVLVAVLSPTAAGLPSTPAVAAAPHAPPAAADPAAAPAEAILALTGLTPSAPKAADRLTVRGTLTNTSGTAWDAVSVRLRLSTRALGNRGEIRQVAAGTAPVRDTLPVAGTEVALPGAMKPGAGTPWTLSVPIKTLHLPGNGVYLMGIEALATKAGTATVTSSGGPTEVGLVHTFLPYLPKKKQFTPTQVSWLWPLVDKPARDAHGAFPAVAGPSAFAAGGRLADLAKAPGTAPVTWMVDPELLDTAAALSVPHKERTGDKTTTVDGDAAAGTWLAALRAQLAGKPVAALPYADPDVAALTRRNLTDRLAPALALARTTTATLLGRESDTALAWPADGFADEAVLGALRRAGATAAILSSDVVAPSQQLTYTPTGRALVSADGKPLEVLVADQDLADAFAGDLSVPGAATLAAQRFLADTAMLTLERPNAARTILVTPPRRWAPPEGWAADLLKATRAAPWMTMVPLATMSRTLEAPELTNASAVYPAGAPAIELGSVYMRRVRAAADAAAEVTGILARPGGLEVGYRTALLRAVSSYWRENREDGRAYLKALGDTIRADRGKVRVIGRSLVTLSSNHGTIPVTVFNELSQSVQVLPVVRPKVGTRLRITQPAMETIAPGRKATFKVKAEATTNGITQVDIRLRSASGRAFGPTLAVKVNATSYGNLGLLVLGAGTTLLFLAAAVRNVRRIRNRGRGAPGAPGAKPNAAGLPPGRAPNEKVQA